MPTNYLNKYKENYDRKYKYRRSSYKSGYHRV